MYLIIKMLGVIIGLLLGIAYLTIVERKYLSSIQRRRGPNVVGLYGLLQPLGDGLKLLVKESISPTSASKGIYWLAPTLTLILGIGSWVVIPMGEGKVLADISNGVLYLLAISALGVYGIIMGGWSSNSRYALLGGMRSAAQMVSYEVGIGFTLIIVIICSNSMNLTEIVRGQEAMWYIVPLLPISIVFIVAALAETNRHPFDLPEAESELVSGYNVEYTGMGFALFFLGEYGNIILMSALTTILFLGGSNIPLIFSIKTFLVICIFVWARAAYPRYRYDQLMRIGWKVVLPVTMGWLLLVGTVMYTLY